MACCAYVACLTAIFIRPLATLVSYAVDTTLLSHIPLVPFIAGYLLSASRVRAVERYRPSLAGTLVCAAVAGAALTGAAAWADVLSFNDGLSVITTAYVALVLMGGFLFLGSTWMRAAAFPIGFLAFMIPLPDAAVLWLERMLVLASADTAAALFRITGTPLLHDGTQLVLPGIVLQVARECSGIRSTWVLFMTGLLASHLLLRSPWHRVAMAALVVPIGIARNAFRIVVIGLLCVHVGPSMIDSALHRRGGPLFYALSLLPLLGALVWLRRRERRAAPEDV